MVEVGARPEQGNHRERRFLQDGRGRPLRAAERAALSAALRGAPVFHGGPVRVRFLPELTSARGQLRTGNAAGTPIHGACFPRKREIVLDCALLANRSELARIAVHEVFHLVWFRLGNPTRASYESILGAEFERAARGELGWPSALAKTAVSHGDAVKRSIRWREYACESFCDTAAWVYGGLRRHPEWTLARRFRERRAEWFAVLASGGPLVL